MKAAIVGGPGQTPVYGDFPEPIPAAGEAKIDVTAAALSPLVKGRAAGSHYSASGSYPHVVGVDGVGRLADGQRVYFVLPRAPYGSMAEQAVVPSAQCVAVPDAVDDVTAAAIANPGMSSWAAFRERANLVAGETVLVNGATGTAGRLAVQIAKYHGAKKVIATGRNAAALQSLAALGADVTIPLGDDSAALVAAFEEQFAGGIDVVVDYLWGQSAELILSAGAAAAKGGRPVRFVQVGSSSGSNITLPGAVLRSYPIALMGSGIGSVPPPRIVHAIGELLGAITLGGFEIATKVVPLADVEPAWSTDTGTPRTVFVIDPKLFP
jgi:NADPH:quinone reductase-like Zn-dependent oxidoreductase